MDGALGIAGLGRSALSLLSQLGIGRFSYRLRSDTDAGASSILFGSLASSPMRELRPVRVRWPRAQAPPGVMLRALTAAMCANERETLADPRKLKQPMKPCNEAIHCEIDPFHVKFHSLGNCEVKSSIETALSDPDPK
jgi:hypothetical protein